VYCFTLGYIFNGKICENGKVKNEKLENQVIFGYWNGQKFFVKKGKSQQIAIFGSSKYLARNMSG
jgi:hypothetical protein